MLVDNDSIINYRERKEESDYRVKSENKSNDVRNDKNRSYISVKGSHCTATPPSIIANRTPPPPSQKHHFTQKHQINFCIDENLCLQCRRRSADASAQLNFISYGTSNCKPDKSSGI